MVRTPDVNIGVFGGTFDPPHVGHLVVAQDALEALGLDAILFVPARVSPFKTESESTPAAVRLAMLEAAVADHPAFRIWDGELRRSGPSYTVDTLESLRVQYPDASLTLLMGVDQWRSFDGWKDPKRILELARVGVMERVGVPAEGQGPPWPHVAVPVRRIDVSSTEVRERVGGGRSIRYLVPESVRARIQESRLYGTTANASRPSSREP